MIFKLKKKNEVLAKLIVTENNLHSKIKSFFIKFYKIKLLCRKE
jgi:hypothetical protein